MSVVIIVLATRSSKLGSCYSDSDPRNLCDIPIAAPFIWRPFLPDVRKFAANKARSCDKARRESSDSKDRQGLSIHAEDFRGFSLSFKTKAGGTVKEATMASSAFTYINT
jgi:hypothetical protein